VDAGVALLVVSLAHTGIQAGPSAPAVTAGARAPTSWTVGVEYLRDRFDYRFENPSTAGTAELVPHFFEQRHDADNVWFTGRVRFTLGSRAFETEGGVSAAATGVSSDYDTFFQPDGNVIVYGTTADTDAWSWRAAQYVGLGSWRGVRFRAAYSYRRDRAGFRPSYSTTVQTRPPSSTSVWNTDRETTVSEVHEVRIGVEHRSAPGRGWQIRLTADAAPTTLARLTTILPDKYPEPVVFVARAFSVNAAVHVTRTFGRWCAGMTASYGGAWGYRDSSDYHRNAVSVGVVIGR
jgi:hypothetical protein